LGAPFDLLAPFFEEAFSGATWAPCSATAAAVSAVAAFSVVIIVRSPSAVITAVRTWITPVPNRSKRILREMATGDGMAMPLATAKA